MIYRLTTDEGKKNKFAYAIGVSDWPEKLIICPKCKREWKKSLMHEYGVNTSIVLSNDNFPDFAWYYIRLISEKAKSILESEGITGLKFEEAQVLSINDLTATQTKKIKNDGVKIKKIPLNSPKYYKMHVGIGAKFHAKSGILLRDSCSECGYEQFVTKGKDWIDSEQPIVLQKGSIKGYDLFIAKGYGVNIFCTEKFFELYNKHNMTGLLFEKIGVI